MNTGANSNSSVRFEIIPAIDIIDGKCVRLSQGDYNQKKIYNEYPLEVAKAFEDAGIGRVHLVDLDGAKAGKVHNWKVLESIASKTNLKIDFGGGIKEVEDVSIVFNSGAQWATIGSLAVKNAELLSMMLLHFGADRFFLGADVKDEKIAVHGWLEQTELDVIDFLNNWMGNGVKYFFCTDISKDGMMQGTSNQLYARIIEQCNGIELTASGGVSTLGDLNDLRAIGCTGAIVGKAIYEGAISLEALKRFALS